MSALTWCGPSSRSTSFIAAKIGRSGQPVQNAGGRAWTWLLTVATALDCRCFSGTTSEAGKVTKSTPMGSIDYPFNPISVALGAEASFVARTIDSDRKYMIEVLRQAAAHEGSALVEIYQNCNIFNDGAWEPLKDAGIREDNLIRLEHGKPVRFGADGQ